MGNNAMTRTINVELLDATSLFLYVANPDDIEHERRQMEAQHHCKLEVFEITYPTHSGARCTRVSWAVV